MTFRESYWCVKGFHFPFAHHRARSDSWHPASVPGAQGKKLELPAWQVHLRAAWSQRLRGLVHRGWGTGSLDTLNLGKCTLRMCWSETSHSVFWKHLRKEEEKPPELLSWNLPGRGQFLGQQGGLAVSCAWTEEAYESYPPPLVA